MLQTPLWYGKPKFHYKVFKNNILFYSCTSIAKDQNEVLETLIERFNGGSMVYKIFCNGILIEKLNAKKPGRKSKYHWSNPK